jgi:acetyl-CoA carboxylase biotin carboxylase subunit
MFRKVLIANRGEIALRVISACKEMGIRTVAVYSEADRNSLHVKFADEAICIGPPASKDSYLNVPAIISAAEITGAEAIHPGYGLLSENANFVEVCHASNIKFIGPTAQVIRMMGEKSTARQTMKAAKVPILPGSDGVIESETAALEWAQNVGYPVILKAVAGGGGRGMRIVRSKEELPAMYQSASTEALNAFSNGDLYMEKFIERPRHIEFQVLADEHGNVMSLGERECSIQRRHQKLIEEAPSLQITPKQRKQMGEVIERSLKEIGYWNAGTIEFLMDEDGSIYFIEMNTRIQVEHCVTEMVTGIDLVKAQLRIAAGEKLREILPDVPKDGPVIRGHAIECRINAEHPEKFTPSPGKITAFSLPGGNGVRVDTAQYAEGVVPQYYDSLIAKLICHGKDRAEAIAKTQRALSQFVVQGIHTSIPLHQRIFADADFRRGDFDTKFMERFLEREKSA